MRPSFVIVIAALAGCAPVQRKQLLQTSVKLEDGRFIGPVEVQIPKHKDHEGHDFEVRVKLVAQCEPLLTLAFPDGEQREFGTDDRRWQDLLRARAGVTGEVQSSVNGVGKPPPPPQRAAFIPQQQQQQQQYQPPTEFEPAPFPVQQQIQQPQYAPPPPSTARAEAGVGVDAELRIPGPTTGRWQRTLSETWTGQLEFEAQRARRCAGARTYSVTYVNAFDDTNTVAIWADVPQELEGAELFIEITELIPPKVVAPVVAAPKPVIVEARVEKPRPPAPAPKKENPRPAKDSGATWQSGQWVWQPGQGEWVWVNGTWLQPRTAPGVRFEDTSSPPIPGCRWSNGYWVWVGTDGSWEWRPGYWKSPPPLVEEQRDSPDPTSKWNSGQWISVGVSFRWEPGRWGRPQPRAETQPPAPRAGASWIPGEWLLITGRWVWSPGFWAGTERPPAPRVEAIPAQPHPDAVWLAGFWRWDVTTRVHVWIGGHWELPPGEGYVWVEEKSPDFIIRGHWELKVRR